MAKVADTLEDVQAGIIDIGGFCFCFEPSNLPLHAFQVMLPFGTMDPVVSVKLARAIYDKVPYMSKVFEDKFNQRLIALIADNGYNLGTSFDWKTVADLKGRSSPEPVQSEMAGVCRATQCSSLPEATPRCRPASTTAGSCSPRATSTSSYEVGVLHGGGFGAITWHGLTFNRDAGRSCRRTYRTSSSRSGASTKRATAQSTGNYRSRSRN